MNTTGIVRRIDDLGRVVIPKEIRKTLRIKEGDPLEIFTNREELIFKKYSPMLSSLSGIKEISSKLSGVLGRENIIFDTDKVICVSDSKNKEIIGAIMSDEMGKKIAERRTLTLSLGDGLKPIKLFRGDDNLYENQMVVPILSNGDLLGAIVVYDFNKEDRFNSFDEKIISLTSSFLSTQFEY